MTYKYDEQEQGVAGEYENHAWLDNWLRLKVQQEQKEFNDLTREEAKKNVRSLTFVQLGLKGKVVIENFPDLTQLNLSNNDLEEIIIRNCPDLKLVQVAHNKLTKLKIEGCPAIKEIYTHNNQLTKWDVPVEDLKNQNLRTISYSDNPLSVEETARLDALGLKDTALKSRVDGPAQEWLDAKYPLDIKGSVEKLDISGLGLQGKLDLKGFTNLKSLDCSDNELNGLNLNDCEELEYLDCSNNYQIGEIEVEEVVKINGAWKKTKKKKKTRIGIKSLDLSKNKELQEIHANHCSIEEINLTGLTKLHTLMLTANKLKELDLSSLVELKELNCALNSHWFKKLDLTNNAKLIGLYCYNNSLEELKVNHLKELEYLYCYDNGLSQVYCNGLKKLKKLFCQGQYQSRGRGGLMDGLDLWGCESLEELDCAENARIKKIDVSNLKNLKSLSCKVTSDLTEIDVSNCSSLTFLDYSLPSNVSVLRLGGTNNLKEIYYSKEAKVFPDWRGCPSLEKIGILEKRQVKDKNGNDDFVCFMEEIDILAQRNVWKVKNILNNPNNYSWNDLENIDKKTLHGVPTDLRDKLISLMVEKYNEELKEKFKPDEKENKENVPPEEEKKRKNPPSEEDKQRNDNPPPKRRKKNNENKDQIINDLHEENEKLKSRIRELENSSKTQDSQQVEKIKKEIEKTKEEINNSRLSKEQKQKLLKLLEKLTNQNNTTDNNSSIKNPSSHHNYNLVWIPVLIGQAALLSALIYAYWCDWKKVVRRGEYK